jgi:outer membrane immunogenic protein
MDRRFVFGIEADIDALRASGSAATVGPTGFYQFNSVSHLGTVVGTANEQVSLRWLSTIRARAGLPVFGDRGLLFVTGGLAVGEASSSGFVNLAAGTLIWGGSNSSTRTGYTVGGGFEYALTDRWTTKVEYLYYDLGNVSHPLNLVVSSFGPATPLYQTLGNTVSSMRGSIIRAGLNYRFNWWGSPIATRY